MNNQNIITPQINREGFSINKSGNLEFDRYELVKLAQKYKTPCYVFSETIIRKKCRQYVNAFSKRNIDFEVIYAGKAFLVKAMCNILKEEGFSLDVSSGGELYTALSAGFPPEKIFFHGNNKSQEEIEFALRENVGNMMIDSEYELDVINQVAESLNTKVGVILRVTPGIDTHTHKYIQTGQVDSKFGINIDRVPDFIKKVLSMKNIIYNGLHFHLGSQIFDLSSYVLAIKEMVKLIRKIKDLKGIDTLNLNLGGGLGVKYLESDSPPSIEYFVNLIVDNVENEVRKNNLMMPKILIEPGRSIVAEAGITLYTIGNTKEISGIRKYLITDGGMADNPRPILYEAKYEGVLVNKANNNLPEEVVTIAGKCCESGDILIKDLKLPSASAGDLLAVFTTGAYHYSMSSNYNRLPRPAVVLVNQGKDDVIVKKETYADIVRNDTIPEWFK
ncbi:MAG: diaminopimelate decarboxylase [Candidatus Caldatribacteriota bacterium]|nr:diaminopimelate decarboxylase [Candidatus Caldatribacteriota bacterium]